MNKKTLTLNTISSENAFYIRFYPGISSSIGSEKATLILGRLEYWFSNNKYVNGFYKFVAPCPHPLYREGDSWAEELGISRKLFAKAFDLIGVRYRSKTAYLKAEDKFQGKLYASYHDRKTNRTYFVRNHEFASQFLKSLFKRKPSPATPSLKLKSSLNSSVSPKQLYVEKRIKKDIEKNGENDTKEKKEEKTIEISISIETENKIEIKEENSQEKVDYLENEAPEEAKKLALQKVNESSPLETSPVPSEAPEEYSLHNELPEVVSQGRSRNGHFGRSSWGDYRGGNDNLSLQRSTPSLELIKRELVKREPQLPKITPSPPEVYEVDEKKMTEEIIEIWKEEIGELGVNVTDHLAKRLNGAFKKFFDQSINSWKSYCQMISSSKFLMGEAQNRFFKKAWITWAIKEETINRIRGGEFRLGDRKTTQDAKIETISFEIKKLECKKAAIEGKISEISFETSRKRTEKIKEMIKTISESECKGLEEDFKSLLELENNSLTEEFRKFGWKGMFVQSYFDGFVEEKVASCLFQETGEEEEKRALESSGMLDILESVCQEIDFVKHKRNSLEREPLFKEPSCNEPYFKTTTVFETPGVVGT